MYKGSRGTGIDLVARLTTEANNCDFKATQSLENRTKLEKLNNELKGEYSSKKIAEVGVAETKELIKRVTDYLNEKKKKGLNAVHAAIYSARSIIPDTSTLNLVIDKEIAYLANEKGSNVNSVEGSAFRAILSLFVRDRFLSATNYIQTQFWDEPLATLDPENSAEVSKYIAVLANTRPIVLTEQKDAVFDAMDYTSYLFRKSEGKTTVRRERIEGERGAE